MQRFRKERGRGGDFLQIRETRLAKEKKKKKHTNTKKKKKKEICTQLLYHTITC